MLSVLLQLRADIHRTIKRCHCRCIFNCNAITNAWVDMSYWMEFKTPLKLYDIQENVFCFNFKIIFNLKKHYRISVQYIKVAGCTSYNIGHWEVTNLRAHGLKSQNKQTNKNTERNFSLQKLLTYIFCLKPNSEKKRRRGIDFFAPFLKLVFFNLSWLLRH